MMAQLRRWKSIALGFATIVIVALATYGLWKSARMDMDRSLRLPLPKPAVAAVAIDEPLQPIPTEFDLDPQKIQLGAKLFNDPQLSGDNTVSCATCHLLQQGGVDNLIVSRGIGGRLGVINTPTVFNSRFNFKQFWDGRAQTLEEQVDEPLRNEFEMGSNWAEIIEKLKRSPAYVAMFDEVYAGEINPDRTRDAIAEFERSLVTPNAPFDRFLKGEKTAISAEAKEGYNRFKSYGCTACHQGVNVGGNMFQSLGVFGDYFQDRGNITKADFGRYNVTGKEGDRFVFKVPSLRNVTLTSPYLHDGAAKTLADAIQVMGKYQLGRELSEEDITLIVQFLITLKGEIPSSADLLSLR
jgi:cytochrome c peroxidase